MPLLRWLKRRKEGALDLINALQQIRADLQKLTTKQQETLDREIRSTATVLGISSFPTTSRRNESVSPFPHAATAPTSAPSLRPHPAMDCTALPTQPPKPALRAYP